MTEELEWKEEDAFIKPLGSNVCFKFPTMKKMICVPHAQAEALAEGLMRCVYKAQENEKRKN